MYRNKSKILKMIVLLLILMLKLTENEYEKKDFEPKPEYKTKIFRIMKGKHFQGKNLMKRINDG